MSHYDRLESIKSPGIISLMDTSGYGEVNVTASRIVTLYLAKGNNPGGEGEGGGSPFLCSSKIDTMKIKK